MDAYQEALDHAVYLRAAIEEDRYSPKLTKEEAIQLRTVVKFELDKLRNDLLESDLSPGYLILYSVFNKLCDKLERE